MERNRMLQIVLANMGLLVGITGLALIINAPEVVHNIQSLPEEVPEILKSISIAGAAQILQGFGVSLENSVRAFGSLLTLLGTASIGASRILARQTR